MLFEYWSLKLFLETFSNDFIENLESIHNYHTRFSGLRTKKAKTSELSHPYCAIVYISTTVILLEWQQVLRLVPLIAWRCACGQPVDGWWSTYVLPRLAAYRQN